MSSAINAEERRKKKGLSVITPMTLDHMYTLRSFVQTLINVGVPLSLRSVSKESCHTHTPIHGRGVALILLVGELPTSVYVYARGGITTAIAAITTATATATAED